MKADTRSTNVLKYWTGLSAYFNKPFPDYSDKHIDEFKLIHYLVAHQMYMSDVESIPAARKAMNSEWKNLTVMKGWGIVPKPQYEDVVRNAQT